MRGQSAARRQADVLRQWRFGGRQPAPGDRTADPAAGSVERAVVAGAGADAGSGGADSGGNDYGYEFVFERPLRGLGRRGRRAVRHHHVRPFRQRCAGAAGGSGDGHRDRGSAGRRRRAGARAVRPCAAGARYGDGAHPGMPHRVGPRRAGTAGGPPGGDARCDGPADRSGGLHRLSCRRGAAGARRARGRASTT